MVFLGHFSGFWVVFQGEQANLGWRNTAGWSGKFNTGEFAGISVGSGNGGARAK
jgi:hypothetical protein